MNYALFKYLAVFTLIWAGLLAFSVVMFGLYRDAARGPVPSGSCSTDVHGTIICTFREPYSGTVLVYPGARP